MIGSLVGQRYGKLIVKRFCGKDKYYDKLWECECDCGCLVIVRQGHLRSGHTTSCGCNKFALKSFVGKRFGNLVVVSRACDYVTPGTGKHYVQWNCHCDCGASVVVLGLNLRSGSVKSCGCANPHALHDLSGQRFGHVLVVRMAEPYINSSGRRLIRYECRCDCGNTFLTLANTLRSGDVSSCGCSVHSKGETKVSEWLNSHDIVYELHKSFDDCRSDIGCKLNFDFYLPRQGVLIECNGVQHYEPVDFFGGEERFAYQLRHDSIKHEYAKQKGFRYLVLDCRKDNLSCIDDILSDFLL